MAREGFRASLRFCAPEILQFLTGTRPPQWGPGADSPCQGEMSRSDRGDRVAVLWARSARRPRPSAILWFLSHRWERNSPPACGEIPPPQKTTEAARRVAAQASLSCPCGAIHLLAPYEAAEPCPLIRLAFGQPPSPQGGRLKKSGQRNSLPSPYHSNSKKFGDFL